MPVHNCWIMYATILCCGSWCCFFRQNNPQNWHFFSEQLVEEIVYCSSNDLPYVIKSSSVVLLWSLWVYRRLESPKQYFLLLETLILCLVLLCVWVVGAYSMRTHLCVCLSIWVCALDVCVHIPLSCTVAVFSCVVLTGRSSRSCIILDSDWVVSSLHLYLSSQAKQVEGSHRDDSVCREPC